MLKSLLRSSEVYVGLASLIAQAIPDGIIDAKVKSEILIPGLIYVFGRVAGKAAKSIVSTE